MEFCHSGSSCFPLDLGWFKCSVFSSAGLQLGTKSEPETCSTDAPWRDVAACVQIRMGQVKGWERIDSAGRDLKIVAGIKAEAQSFHLNSPNDKGKVAAAALALNV